MSEQTIDLIKDRSIRLFTYLSELTRLREPVIRSIDKNEQVLWFSDLPEEQECFSQAHGYEKEKDDIWLEIKKPMLPELPLLPIELTEWIKCSDLYNVLEEPQLMNHIPIPLLEDEESEEIKYLYLDDHPEINTGWKEYLENKWKSWRDEYLRSKKVQEVYSDLFGIYHLQKKLGEQFELIVGIGLLNWYTPSGQSVSRHLITKRVEIELNSDTGVITVRPSSEDEVTLEQDMLEVSERPDIDAQKDINNLLPSIAEDFWKKDNFELVLRSWVQTVSAEGRYLDKISRVKEFNNNPIVSFSPALILRKRTEKSFLRTYLTIINELKEGNNSIPLGVKRTVDILDDNNYNSKEIDLTKEEKVRDAEEYYLPLPTNDEQLKIVEQLKYRNGVIVQGPPGTGKSHTIANLICHLLSSGKKILITSQTPRALKVLKEKIPKELQSLCVSLLGNDSNSLKELENVVQGITDRHYKWDQVLNKKEINKLKADLHDLRSKQAQVRSKIRSIREVETYQHNLLKGEYRGTAQAIGTKIRSECAQLGWLDIKVPLDKPISHTNDEAVELIHLRRELNKEIIDEVQKSFLEPDFILKPDEMNDLFQREANAKEKWNQYKGLQTSEEFNALLKVQSDELLMTKTMIENLQNHFTGLAKYKGEWVKKAINDVLTNELSVWVELSRTLNEGLNGLMEVARFADAREIYIPEQYLATIVLADAKVLYNHLKNGGKLGFPGLRPKAVKIGWYILKEIRVDGKLCDNAEIIDELIKCITANERISKHLIIVQTQMAGNIHNHPARAIIVSELERISRELNTILNTKILVDQLASEVPSISDSNINTDNIHDNLNYYNELIDSIFAYKLLLTEEDSINQINEPLLKIINDKEAHDINQKLIEVIKNRDIKKYHSIFEELKELSTNLLKYKRFKELHNRLDPQIANILNSTGIDTDFKLWEQRLNRFEDSWRWAQANNWFHQFSNKDEKELKSEYSYLEKKIMQKITKLSSLKAWEECLKKLTETERQHLISWTYSMRKIGKDTGKNAYKHKKSAMEHMSYCRSAIPAWIMPLYRVVESFEPVKELFDVVIIDEASQSGPESIFLMYMAKQVIVVGDDMQISPENIGIPRDDVDYLRQKYIHDLPHSDQFGVDNSFFDLANILFGGRIILREHFRCMPEIIQFSNNLSYQNTPLIPLRQYPPNRLHPVNAIHVTKGYREGRGQSVKNVPEAEAIVKKMVECIADPIYKDKSFGVISLQGNLQAKIIENFLLKDIGPEEMERRNIICGDAYAFQGDERDVIFLSLVAADGETSMRALTSAKDKRRFNVAASRAKDQLWLFHTPTLNDFRNKECLRYQIVSYCQNPAVQPTSGARSDCESEFEKAVYDKIVQRGYRVIPQYEVSGYSIDLVVEGMEGRIAVECDGDFWHGPEKYASDMSRQRTLERCGWTFWRVRGSEFYYNPTKALESLWELLTQHNIKTQVLNRIDEELVIKQENKDTGLTANELETVSIKNSLVNNTPKEVIKPILADQLNLFGNQLKIDDYLSLPEEDETENTAEPLSINYTKVNPREPNKLTQPKSFNLVEVLNNKGIEVVDKRKSKGSLWVIGGIELTVMFKELEEKGYEFVFTKKGGRTTKKRSGWYLK